jgi:hypothetical protein
VILYRVREVVELFFSCTEKLKREYYLWTKVWRLTFGSFNMIFEFFCELCKGICNDVCHTHNRLFPDVVMVVARSWNLPAGFYLNGVRFQQGEQLVRYMDYTDVKMDLFWCPQVEWQFQIQIRFLEFYSGIRCWKKHLLNELDSRKPLMVSNSPGSEELGLHSLV